MSGAVEFVMTLKDAMTGGLEKIGKEFSHTKNESEKLHASTSKLKGAFTSLNSIAMTMGVGLGLFKIAEYFTSAFEEASKLKVAEEQVKTGLESTGYAAGVGFADIEKINKGIYNSSTFTREELMKMSSLLVTFPGITKKNFGAASQIVADMATRMHQDVQSTAIQVGKALQDPVLGMTALRRVGVNLSAEQTEHVKKLVEAGKKEAAQQLILNELQSEFGGSAKSAYDATPLIHYKKMMDEFKDKVGTTLLTVAGALEPVFNYVSGLFSELGDYLEENKADIASIAGFVGGVLKGLVSVVLKPLFNIIAWIFKGIKDGNPIIWSLIGAIAAYKAIALGMIAITKLAALWQGIQLISINVLGDAFLTASVKEKLFAAAQWILNAAMDANPVGLIVLAIAALVAIVWSAINAYSKWGAALLLVLGPIGLIVNMVMALKNNWDSIDQAFSGGHIIRGLKRVGVVLLDAILYPVQQLLGLLAHIPGLGYLAGRGEQMIANLRKSLNLITPESNAEKTAKSAGGIAPAKIPGTAGAAAAGGDGKAKNKKTAESVASGGTRNTQITINLGKMVENIVFQGGIKENAQDVTRQVEEALMRVLYAAESAQ